MFNLTWRGLCMVASGHWRFIMVQAYCKMLTASILMPVMGSLLLTSYGISSEPWWMGRWYGLKMQSEEDVTVHVWLFVGIPMTQPKTLFSKYHNRLHHGILETDCVVDPVDSCNTMSQLFQCDGPSKTVTVILALLWLCIIKLTDEKTALHAIAL